MLRIGHQKPLQNKENPPEIEKSGGFCLAEKERFEHETSGIIERENIDMTTY